MIYSKRILTAGIRTVFSGIIVSGTMLAAPHAHALKIKNCSSKTIRVHIDRPGTDFTKPIRSGKMKSFALGQYEKDFDVNVRFTSGGITSRFGGMIGGGEYTVSHDGRFKMSNGTTLCYMPAPTPEPEEKTRTGGCIKVGKIEICTNN